MTDSIENRPLSELKVGTQLHGPGTVYLGQNMQFCKR